jgi:hypothetical protein
MKTKNITRAMTLLAILTLSSGFLSAAGKPEDEAQKAAEQWLSLTDTGDFSESWKTAAEYFQAAVPLEQWQRSSTPFGSHSVKRFHASSRAPNTLGRFPAPLMANMWFCSLRLRSQGKQTRLKPSLQCLTKAVGGEFLDITSSE